MCSNYRSYASPAVLDLQKRSFTTNFPKDGDWTEATNQIAAIFGPNASGKTNVLRALSMLAFSVQTSIRNAEAVKELRNPHMLHREEITEFQAEYLINNVRYRWNLSLSDDGVFNENLDANLGRQWRMVFERNKSSIKFGPQSKIPARAKENISEYLTPWALTLSAWSVVKSRGIFFDAAKWWMESITSLGPRRTVHPVGHDKILDLVEEPGWMEAGVHLINAADVGVAKFSVDTSKIPSDKVELLKKIKEFMDENFNSEKSDSEEPNQESPQVLTDDERSYVLRNLKFVHGKGDQSFALDEEDESQGTLTWLDLSLQAVHAIVKGEVLIVDEIDSSLHPLLLQTLLEIFKDPALNSKGAQLIFSTHDLTLLGRHPSALVEPSEAYLAEKVDGFSELIAWDEYEIRKNHNLEKRYLQGVYGAVPHIEKHKLAQTIQKLSEAQLRHENLKEA